MAAVAVRRAHGGTVRPGLAWHSPSLGLAAPYPPMPPIDMNTNCALLICRLGAYAVRVLTAARVDLFTERSLDADGRRSQLGD